MCVQDVVEMSKKFLPFMASSFDNERVHLMIGDGMDYLANLDAEFDVLITDSTDPQGWSFCLVPVAILG